MQQQRHVSDPVLLCRLWIEKQEAAFAAWLNCVLVPAKSAEGEATSLALAARRLTAKARGLLWHLYSADKEVISAMMKVEKHIEAGQLRLKDEVSLMMQSTPARLCSEAN